MPKPEPSGVRRVFGGIVWTCFWLALLYGSGLLGFFYYIYTLRPVAAGRAEAIVVLTGGVNRIQDGLAMQHAGMAPMLFISGVGEGVTVASLLKISNVNKAPPCCIMLGHTAQNTRQNAIETAAWAHDRHVHSLLLVTAPYHMPRAWVELHAALPEVVITPSPARPSAEGYEKINFLKLIFLEYNKTILAWARIYVVPFDKFLANRAT